MLNHHVRFVSRVLRRAGVPAANLDDEVQRTFIVAASRLEQLRLGAEQRFLHQVALNVAAHARRTGRRRRVADMEGPPQPAVMAPSPEQIMNRKRLYERFNRIVDALDESARAVFVLHFLDEKSLREIGVLLDIPRGTAASRLQRALRQFRDHATVAVVHRNERHRNGSSSREQ